MIRRSDTPPSTGLFLFLFACLAALACGGEESPGDTPTPPARSLDRSGDTVRPFPHADRTRSDTIPPETIGGLQARWSPTPGVVADLLTAERRDGVLAVTIRLRNTSARNAVVELETDGGTYRSWSLTVGGREYPLLRDGDGPRIPETVSDTLAPGETKTWHGRFRSPPPAAERFDLAIPGMRPFTDVPIFGEG